MNFGSHVSIAGGIDKAPERAFKLGCECFQIFTRSPRGGKPPELGPELIDSFLNKCEEYNLKDYYVHTPYYINLSSPNKDLRKSSINIIVEELRRSSSIGARYVMTHLGSSRDTSREKAVKMVAESVKVILGKGPYETRLLLENTAGQGDTIGDSFEELAYIIDDVDDPVLGICLDTAHLFASGYDIRTRKALDSTLIEFCRFIDIDRVKLLHGNDSKPGLGERKDRHEQIGKGKIGLSGFEAVINNPHLIELDMIVEIPPDIVKEDIETLKKLRGDSK